MANQVYYGGDFWQVVEATGRGESPDTAPEKFRRIDIPKSWRNVLVQLTYAHLLQIDGQTDKAIVELSRGNGMLDDLVRADANMQGRYGRANVG